MTAWELLLPRQEWLHGESLLWGFMCDNDTSVKIAVWTLIHWLELLFCFLVIPTYWLYYCEPIKYRDGCNECSNVVECALLVCVLCLPVPFLHLIECFRNLAGIKFLVSALFKIITNNYKYLFVCSHYFMLWFLFVQFIMISMYILLADHDRVWHSINVFRFTFLWTVLPSIHGCCVILTNWTHAPMNGIQWL